MPRGKLVRAALIGILGVALGLLGVGLLRYGDRDALAAGEYGMLYIDVLPDASNTTTGFGDVELCRDTDDTGGPLDIGETFTVHIVVSAANDLARPSWVLNYNHGVLQINSYDWSSWKMGPGGQDVSDSTPDADGSFSTSYEQSSGVNGDGVLQAIVLKATADGTSDLTLTDVDLADSGGIGHFPPEVLVHDYLGTIRVSVGTPCPADTDGDTVFDSLDNCPLTPNSDQADFDGDGVPGTQPPPGRGWGGDACDVDDDSDLLPDDFDPCPFNPDCDDDGVGDFHDNCRLIANTDQLNTDGDMRGDVCDPDDDNDTILDDGDSSGEIGDNPCTGGNTVGCDDNCRLNVNPDQADGDSDGKGNVCDNCPLTANASQADNDGDGIPGTQPGPGETFGGDACDADDDNDDVLDVDDNCPLTANASQADNDGDGIPGTQPGPGDTFGGDACDADDDNDGMLDVDEAPGCEFDPDCDDDSLGLQDGQGRFFFRDGVELFMGTDPLDNCSDNPSHDAWPPDFNNDTRVNLADIAPLRDAFNSQEGEPSYNRRVDLTANGRINLEDIVPFRAYFNTRCA